MLVGPALVGCGSDDVARDGDSELGSDVVIDTAPSDAPVETGSPVVDGAGHAGSDSGGDASPALPDYVIVLGLQLNYGDCSVRRLMAHRVARAVEVAATLDNPVYVLSGKSNPTNAVPCAEKRGLTEAAQMAAILVREHGVDASDILMEEESTDTLQNGQNVATLLADMPYASLSLVSSSFHVHRGSPSDDQSATAAFNRPDAFGAGTFVEGVNVFESSSMAAATSWASDTVAGLSDPEISFADVDSDGDDDVVTFHREGVSVRLSDGFAFGENRSWSSHFRESDAVRALGDVNGDDRADVVVFGATAVEVAHSDGVAFGPLTAATTEFGTDDGWTVTNHHRLLSDVNGDGRDDIVGFGNGDVLVALSNGTGFDAAAVWGSDQSPQSTSIGGLERELADVDGDGDADIVSFGDNDVFVSLSNGSEFVARQPWLSDDEFGNAADFTRGQGYVVGANPRGVSDVDGDGRSDLWAIGSRAVFVALSVGTRFEHLRGVWYYHTSHRHGEEVADFAHFTSHVGWAPEDPRFMADVTGDGMSDVVGIRGGETFVSRALSP
jgi:hypothetical protein